MMLAVFCKFNPVTGWQSVKVIPVNPDLQISPVKVVNGLLRITTRQYVRGGRFVNPKKLVH